MKNSFAKNVHVQATTIGDIEGVDVASFKNIAAILAALTPKSTTKLLPSDFGVRNFLVAYFASIFSF